ncbi:radical SAM protein [Vibrio diabolicus]|uniref:radical SAM protein n=1 Tax=Vibrio diabolicus TaxID=50719 RepID=UPI0029417E12|nr:radical SAM protein [Vibrio diabolicus]MDV5062286.1 radical SAM protein [Vibrio diabolicus]
MQHLKYLPGDNRFIYQGKCSDIQLAQVVWHITGACKLNCAYCFGPPKDQVFCISRIEEVLSCLKEFNVQKIDISGGEPLLYKELATICNLLVEAGIHLTLTTSGLGTKKNIDWLLDSVDLFQRIIFSLDSIERENHNLVRDHHRAFDSVINLIQKVKDRGGLVRVNTVVTNVLENDEELENFSNYIQQLKPEEWCVIEPKVVESNERFFVGDYVTTKSNLDKIMCKIRSTYDRVIIRKSDDYSKYYILQPDCSFQLHSKSGPPSFSIDFNRKNLEVIRRKIKENDVILPIDKG